jgi:rRNA maturation endonuclease Nob1
MSNSEPIMLRVSKEVRDQVVSAAYANGMTLQEWIREAINYSLINRTNICPKCGTINRLSAYFCDSCGENLIQKRREERK